MPYITNELSSLSTVTGWQKREVSKNSYFDNLKPKFLTADKFSQTWGRLPYRDSVNLAQVYTERSREDHLADRKKCLEKFPCNRTLQVRWKLDKELPSFSMDFLFLYLSRFGKVEALYQQAANACLALFDQERAARLVSSTRDLGLPYGRLYTRWWNPLPQDKDQLKVMRHIEKACETRARFNSIMDEDDRRASKKHLRAGARAMAEGNKFGGPHLMAYLCEGVRRIAQTKPVKPPTPIVAPLQRTGMVHVISSPEEFYSAIKEDILVVVDFYAVWCVPCVVIYPVIQELAKEFMDVLFLKVNVDELTDICERFNVSAMPTFSFFKNNTLLDTIVGGYREKLRERILVLK